MSSIQHLRSTLLVKLAGWSVPALLVLGEVPAQGQTLDAPPLPSSERLSLMAAVQMTLSLQPEIRISEQQVAISRGAVQRATGQFDVALQAGISQRGDTTPLSVTNVATTPYLGGSSSLTTYTTDYFAGLTKQFRWGMSVSSTIQISRVAQNAGNPPYSQSVLVFSVAQPLLRGRGAAATAAVESAARVDQEVSLMQLSHLTAQRIRDTCIAYWNYGASYQSVTRWMEAEERARLTLTEEERLVQAAEHPAVGLKLLAANLADVTASRADAQRQALDARQALGLAMGLPWEEIERLAPPSDDFISVAEGSLLAGPQMESLIKTAWQRRADLLAASAQIHGAQILSHAAHRLLEPRLDLQVDLGYAGLAEGGDVAPFFTAPYERVSGVNFFTGLTLQYPLQNNAARGEAFQRDAEQKRAILIRDNLRREIGTRVALLASSLRTSLITLKSAEAAVAAYREAVENERKKVRAGLTTLFDVIQIQGRLNTAEQNALVARARVSTLVAQLRFESGTLIDPKPRPGTGTKSNAEAKSGPGDLHLELPLTMPVAH